MILPRQTGRLAALTLCVLIPSVFLLTVCDGGSSTQENARQAEAQRQEQIQAQLQAEQAQRLEAQDAARAAKASRNSWIGGLAGGACAACVVVLLIGIHIGARVVSRYRKEHRDE